MVPVPTNSDPVGNQDHLQDPRDALLMAGANVCTVPRAACQTTVGLNRAIRQQQIPVLFNGLAHAWSAYSAWQPDQLRITYGNHEVTALIDLPTQGVLYPQDQRLYERILPFAEFIDIMMNASPASPCYLAYKRAEGFLDTTVCDFGSLLGSTAGDGSDTRVWIGSAGTRSMLHSDLKDNLFCQIWGEKIVTLLPWRDSIAAYPFRDNLVNSQIDVANPDVARFPRLRRVTWYSSVVRPGDIIYIPRGCWHDIRSLTPSVSVNHWFGPARSGAEYLALLGRLGPKYWLRTGRDFVVHGMLKHSEEARFFFSPPSTGKRLYDSIRTGNFSSDNDPSA
jgi:hypothetical protein